MNTRSFRKIAVLAVGLVCLSAPLARADRMVLQEKLSKDVKIQLNDVTIAEVLEKIGRKAGLKFVLSDQAAWKLPQGRATRLSVMLRGPLAGSMTEMLNAFFMRYAVGDDEITIYPRPELDHILGRPTAKQLELLNAIYTRPIRRYFLDEVQRSINEAMEQEVLISPILVQEQINDLLRQLVGETARSNWKRGSNGRWHYVRTAKERRDKGKSIEFQLPTPVTLVQLLSQVSIERHEPDDTRWYISGTDFPGQVPEIRVVDYGLFRRFKFDQKIDISYKNERLDTILQDLATRSGAKLLVAPGSSQLHKHLLSVSMQNITIEQAARNIIGMVGGSHKFGHNWEIFVNHKSQSFPMQKPKTKKSKDSSNKVGSSEGYVGKISIPMDGGKYYIEFMLRESDLTEQLKALRAEKMEEVLGRSPKSKPAAVPPGKSK